MLCYCGKQARKAWCCISDLCQKNWIQPHGNDVSINKLLKPSWHWVSIPNVGNRLWIIRKKIEWHHGIIALTIGYVIRDLVNGLLGSLLTAKNILMMIKQNSIFLLQITHCKDLLMRKCLPLDIHVGGYDDSLSPWVKKMGPAEEAW